MNDFKKKMLPVYVFAKGAVKRLFRDKTAMFFTFMFPLIFLFVFGGIFSGDSGASFNIAVINRSESEFAQQFVGRLEELEVYKVDQEVSNLEEAKEKMNRGQIDAAVVLPEGYGDLQDGVPTGDLQVIYSQNSASAGQTLTNVLQGHLNAYNDEYTDLSVPLGVTAEQTNEQGLSQFDYTFSGLLGFAIIGIGIFGPVNVFPELKKQGILRRLHTTPLRVWQYFIANVVANTIVGLLTVIVMFAVALTVFNLQVVGNLFELTLFLILSIVAILGIGLAIGGWASNERQAAPLSNIVVFPMMFLSGTFFPRFLMPEWLQSVSAYLPLTPVIDGVRLLATEGKHLVDIMPQIGLLAAWTIVIYIIAFRVFRWE